MNQEKIGKFIRKCRKEKSITQKEFSEKLGVTDKTVSRWENGHYLPDVSLFNDICEILGIEVAELLKGEKIKDNINREDVDETIMKIVDISSDEIKKKKNKAIIISSIIIVLLIMIFGIILIFRKEKVLDDRPKVGELVPFPSQIAIKEKEDGWICHFNIEYLKDDINNPYYYGYDCENFKYKELYEFTARGQEIDENGIFDYKVEVNHPMYIYNSNYDTDIRNIGKYFSKKKFNDIITISDLDELVLKYISKEEILELYNEAISSPKVVKWGNTILLNHPSYMNVSMTKDDYTWSVGYLMNFGHIKYVNIELKIHDQFLSDLIKENKTTEEQKEIYNNIIEIENYIIEKQSFILPKKLENLRPYNFLLENFHDINNLEKN